MAKASGKRREVAILKALSLTGSVVEEQELSLEEYYQGSHPLIDSNEYRAARGIAVLEGRLYGASGRLEQEFRNRYSTSGAYEGGRAVHADGTVIED